MPMMNAKTFLCMSAALPLLAGASANLLQNASFDDSRPASGWSLPRGWKVEGSAGRGGTQALVWREGAPSSQAVSNLKLEHGVSYRLTAWIRGAELAKGSASVVLEWRNASRVYIDSVRAQEVIDNDVSALDGWKRYEALTPAIPVDASFATISCRVSGDAAGSVRFDDLAVEPVAQKWMDFLVSSAYRDIAWEGSVRFAAPLFVNTVRHPLDTVAVELSYLDAGGKAVKAAPAAFTSSEAVFEVPVANMKPGRQEVTARIFAKDGGKEFGSCSLAFTRTKSAPKRRVWLDAKGRTILDGKPFFPLGVYTSRKFMDDEEFARLGRSPFNSAMEYATALTNLDKYAAHGIMVALDVRDFREARPEAFRKFLSKAAAHPATLGWYVADEPKLDAIPAIAKMNAFLQEEDPDHPTWLVHDRPNVQRFFMRCCDVLGMDPYPIGNGGSGARGAIAIASDWPREARRQTFGFRPMWQVPQAYNWHWHPSRAVRYGAHFPTRDEMANMNWQAVAAGANGLCLYSHHAMRRHFDVGGFDKAWRQVCETADEVRRMIPVLLSDGDAPKVSGVPEDLLAVRTFLHEGQTWVLAVNRTTKPVKATLRLPSAISVSWPRLGMRGWALAKNGELAIDLPGLGYVFTECIGAEELRRRADGCRVGNLPVACREETPVAGEEPSLLPTGRVFRLVWNDEFNGTALDTSKWGYRTNFWGESAYWYARPEDGCVEITNGCAHLRLGRRADGQFISPQLQTGELVWDTPRIPNPKRFWPFGPRERAKFVHRYGYYECRCRLQKMPGWWSAFWMQTQTQGVTIDPARDGIEHDIMESFDPGKVIPACFHYNGTGPEYRNFCIPDEHPDVSTVDIDTDSLHRYGLMWTPNGYSVYIDGRLRGTSSKAVSQAPEFILVSTEAIGFRPNHPTRKGDERLAAAYEAKDEFVVDYVRVFDIVEGSQNGK